VRRGRSNQRREPWSVESLENMVADVEYIKASVAPGCSRQDLRRVTTAMREIANGRFLQAWRKIGLSGQPHFQCLRYTGNGINSQTIAICGQAEDIPQNVATLPFAGLSSIVVGTSENSEPFIVPAIGLSWLTYDADPIDCTMSNANDPFVEDSLAITKFFEGCVIHFRGVKITRNDVIKHIATMRDAVHYGRLSQQKNDKKASVLDTLAGGLIHNRDVVFYVFLAIAQNFSSSPDTDKFLATAKQFLAPNGT
jgi:hypothetical protein